MLNKNSVYKLKISHMKQLRSYRKKLWKNPRLKFLFIELTTQCNEHCRHCGSSCGNSVPKNLLTCSEICDFLKKTSAQFDVSDFQLCITGGEPLMREDFFEIMNYAASLGYNWGMTTNGILIDEDTAHKLAMAKMRTVSISIDGLPDTHDDFRMKKGSFEAAMSGIRNLTAENAFKHVQVTTVVHKKCLGELDELYRLLAAEKLNSWRVINIEPIGRALSQPELLLDEDDYRKMFDFIRRNRKSTLLPVTYGCSHFLGYDLEREVRSTYFLCNSGIYTASVAHNGDIIGCLDIERRPELVQGNIRSDDFKTVWENEFRQFRGDTRKCTECSKCRYYRFCGGDAFHSWDFDLNKPKVCFKGILFE